MSIAPISAGRGTFLGDDDRNRSRKIFILHRVKEKTLPSLISVFAKSLYMV